MLVEKSAAATESLKTQAEQLVAAVALFKLRAGDSVHVAAALPRAVASASPSPAERRGSDRATDVVRPPFRASAIPAPAAAATGTDDWTSF